MLVSELLTRFPYLRAACRDYMDDAEPLPYIAFGCVLIPFLEEALASPNVAVVEEICEYLEAVARESRSDSRMMDLLKIEIGEWLPSVAHQDILAPRLGSETKRICGYVPGFTHHLRLSEITITEKKINNNAQIAVSSLMLRHRNLTRST
jgi:hypothetical protein